MWFNNPSELTLTWPPIAIGCLRHHCPGRFSLSPPQCSAPRRMAKNPMSPKVTSHEILLLAALTVMAMAVILVCLERRNLQAWIDWLGTFFSPEPKPDANANWRLFWISFAALYVEIMMIRWIGTEVRVFAYFQNLSLIACFLGFGLGCYWSGRHKSLVFSLLAMVGLTILAKAPQRTWQVFLSVLSGRLSISSDAAMWSSLEQGGLGSTTWLLVFA